MLKKMYDFRDHIYVCVCMYETVSIFEVINLDQNVNNI